MSRDILVILHNIRPRCPKLYEALSPIISIDDVITLVDDYFLEFLLPSEARELLTKFETFVELRIAHNKRNGPREFAYRREAFPNEIVERFESGFIRLKDVNFIGHLICLMCTHPLALRKIGLEFVKVKSAIESVCELKTLLPVNEISKKQDELIEPLIEIKGTPSKYPFGRCSFHVFWPKGLEEGVIRIFTETDFTPSFISEFELLDIYKIVGVVVKKKDLDDFIKSVLEYCRCQEYLRKKAQHQHQIIHFTKQIEQLYQEDNFEVIINSSLRKLKWICEQLILSKPQNINLSIPSFVGIPILSGYHEEITCLSNQHECYNLIHAQANYDIVSWFEKNRTKN